MKIISRNKTANYNYFIEDKYEAGIKLVGSEIKSIRLGKVSLNEAFITFKDNEAFVSNMHIATYDQANRYNHQETRPRKLLLHKNEILKLFSKSREQGYSVIPLSLYLKEGLAKVEIALAKGKKDYDKREDLKKKDQDMRLKKTVNRYK
ncbi:SsrA-binding protein SmpB [Haploplasma axanthum]|uniref:SsrA-binding protein n=1 Tax=Haploplasma axanthum TaxID=29552 RepID=A0A449BE03_HAPAX|nr:SsrA-binding protein SmpB [Haploplasma axanthum]VEU80657.1 ssrA-binding protein [Haploplasma axanthum]